MTYKTLCDVELPTAWDILGVPHNVPGTITTSKFRELRFRLKHEMSDAGCKYDFDISDAFPSIAYHSQKILHTIRT